MCLGLKIWRKSKAGFERYFVLGQQDTWIVAVYMFRRNMSTDSMAFFVLRESFSSSSALVTDGGRRREKTHASVPRASYKGARNAAKEASSCFINSLKVVEGEEEKGHPILGQSILEGGKAMYGVG